ncbi:HyaD/HybD family hydrogenase maturation endopeptidase [Segnochrobactrum spirostomi]|uniref:Hydrogenase expression/formation protein HupD n=1 Tax=Segnochrobactrum spirostomi TaxID=2608987 RepID=A0A6A7YCE7_9HYPH|nr:HyaD/HybD family hydrogenase maturation endopeptidase [Segnochrobactrum spirostomi]MQT15362.1 HyaD/HybD family hydrogenase maturation endopeptidase [Segnochrobactrum spirostomi]
MDDPCAADGDRILVLGIGNILWADEGFGVRVIEALDSRYELPANVTVLDGGTQGLYLLPHLEDADGVILVDAIDYGLPPATLKVLRDDEVPAVLGARKVSLHQTGFQEVLALLHFRGCAPRRLRLVGIQPERLDDYGGGLTPAVADKLEPALAAVLAILADDFGIAAVPRTSHDGFAAPAVSREVYEGGRPSPEAACRVGDARVLAGWTQG